MAGEMKKIVVKIRLGRRDKSGFIMFQLIHQNPSQHLAVLSYVIRSEGNGVHECKAIVRNHLKIKVF